MKPINNQFVAGRAASKTRMLFRAHDLAVVLSFFLSAVCLRAQETPAAPAEGEKLEKEMAANIKAKNWKAVESRIADGFQSVHPDGPRDRAGEIALLKKMNFGDFALSNFKATVVGDNIVVTFTMTVAQIIDGRQLPAKPAYRLSVWRKGADGWQWISHANLAAIP